jgi:hypothetical protein
LHQRHEWESNNPTCTLSQQVVDMFVAGKPLRSPLGQRHPIKIDVLQPEIERPPGTIGPVAPTHPACWRRKERRKEVTPDLEKEAEKDTVLEEIQELHPHGGKNGFFSGSNPRHMPNRLEYLIDYLIHQIWTEADVSANRLLLGKQTGRKTGIVEKMKIYTQKYSSGLKTCQVAYYHRFEKTRCATRGSLPNQKRCFVSRFDEEA